MYDLVETTGLICHFPPGHNLLVALYTYAPQNWEGEQEELAGGRSADELTDAERYRTLTLSLGKNDLLAELLLSICA